MRVLLIALLAAISYAQTDASSGATGSVPAQQPAANCWPWWCAGDNADSSMCKFWIMQALARGCNPYMGMMQPQFQNFFPNPMFPVGPVMGPGMPIQGFATAPAADTGMPIAPQQVMQAGDTGMPAPPQFNRGMPAFPQMTPQQMAFYYMMRDGDESSVIQQMMQGQVPQNMDSGKPQPQMPKMPATPMNPMVVDAARMMTGQDIEMPDVERPEQDVEGMPFGMNPFQNQQQNFGGMGLKLQKEKTADAQEPVAEKKTHHGVHMQTALKAMHMNDEWTSTGMWFGLSFLFLLLGGFAGYSIMNYLQKRQAMNCWASYGWDVPLTSRTDTV